MSRRYRKNPKQYHDSDRSRMLIYTYYKANDKNRCVPFKELKEMSKDELLIVIKGLHSSIRNLENHRNKLVVENAFLMRKLYNHNIAHPMNNTSEENHRLIEEILDGVKR